MKTNKFNLEKILNKFICGDSLQKMKNYLVNQST